MANAVVSLTIPEAEVAEAKEAAEAFTGLVKTIEPPFTPTAKELLAAVANEVVRKWRNETKGQTRAKIA